MEKYKTYFRPDTQEYASYDWDYNHWVTHASPILLPLEHTKEAYYNYMRETANIKNFEIPEYFELIEVEVKRLQ